MMAAPTRRLAGAPACTSTPGHPQDSPGRRPPQAGRSRGRLGRLAAEPESRQQPSSAKPSLKNWIPRRSAARPHSAPPSGHEERNRPQCRMAVADAMDSDEESPNGSSRMLSRVVVAGGCGPIDHAEHGRQLIGTVRSCHGHRAVRDQTQRRAPLLGGPAWSPLDPYDANRPGVYRWMITRAARSVASGVAADRDRAANDAATDLSGLPGSPLDVGHPGGTGCQPPRGQQRIVSASR
jgi:hypothetical protein